MTSREVWLTLSMLIRPLHTAVFHSSENFYTRNKMQGTNKGQKVHAMKLPQVN
ncbi:hypothetical protein AAHE18_11G113800 [Arachis hypogaea]